MIATIVLPERVNMAITNLNQQKQEKVLRSIANELSFLYRTNCYNIYGDIVNYTFFDNFLNSFVVIKNNGKEVLYFFDESELENELDIERVNEFDNNLFEGLIQIKKQEKYIDRIDKLKFDIQFDIEKYFSNEFWKEFNKEGR